MSSILIASTTEVGKRRMKELWELDFEGSKKDYFVGKVFAEIAYDASLGKILIGPVSKGPSKYAAKKLWSNDVVIAKISEQLRIAFVNSGLVYQKDFTIEVI